MAENADHRKLAAILCADVKGYSKLMGEDESYTVGALKECRKLFAENIQNHEGRVVNAPGDSILAEFPSVVSAVQCAVEIQNQLNDRNAELPDNRKMVFRIGVNLGDVIQSEDAIYGDGVNIAARIEGLAEPSGVSISRSVFNQVRNKLPFGYEYQGEHQVKNITNPVKVYKLLTAPDDAGKLIGMEPGVSASKWIWPTVVVAAIVVTLIGYQVYQEIAGPKFEPASVEKMAYPLPEKPSIAVLPFKNLSGDPKQNYLSEGLTEQIISTLSRFRTLFVISGNSTSTYKGKNVKIQNVAEDLGVRYVLEGSLQTSADRIRITAQLIDATTGHYIWSQRYDREQKEIFAIQDDITLEITKALQSDVMSGEQARIWAKNSTTNLEAWEKWLQGDEYFFRITKDDNATARRLFEEAIVLDAEYAFAYVMLGWTYWFDARFGWVDSRAESFKMAGKYAQKGMELNDTLDNAYLLMGSVYFQQGQHDKAIAEVERAIALNPNGANNYIGMAGMVGGLGRWDESIQLAKKAIRLHPFAPALYYHYLGSAYFMTGQLDESITTIKKALHARPNYLPAHAFLAACYSSLDRHAEAAAAADEVRRINPKFNLESYAKRLPYKNKADKERYIAALRKAGLPDNPPLPIPDKPSIAVLPFDNLSGDPEQEYFSDGITEDIITALSKTPKMLVIARNSTFTYKGKPVKVQQVADELGVRYVLEGSVQKVGERVRITAQLVDAKSGHHLWAERYDRDLKDIFALQDEITIKIINALQVEITEGEHARLWRKGTDNIEAYLKLLQAREYYLTQTKEGNALARRFAEEAIALDPEYAPPYHILSITHFYDVFYRTTKSPQQSIKKALELVQKAIALDDSYALAHGWSGFLSTFIFKKYEKGIMEAQKGVDLDPNGAHGYLYLSLCLRYAGEFEEAIQAIEKAIRLNPFPPVTYFKFACPAYIGAGRYEEAIAAGKKAVEVSPSDAGSHMILAVAYSLAGRQEEARIAAKEVLRLNPKFSVALFRKRLPYKNQADTEHVIEAMLNVGLPE